MYISGLYKDRLLSNFKSKLETVNNPVSISGLISILDSSFTEVSKSINNILSIPERTNTIWGAIHWKAKVADNDDDVDGYVSFIYDVSKWHPCEQCRIHMKPSLDKLNKIEFNSCFEHSVAFHNLVNEFLKKPIMSLGDAENIYNMKCNTCTLGLNVKKY